MAYGDVSVINAHPNEYVRIQGMVFVPNDVTTVSLATLKRIKDKIEAHPSLFILYSSDETGSDHIDHTPVNYSSIGDLVDNHVAGIDNALGSFPEFISVSSTEFNHEVDYGKGILLNSLGILDPTFTQPIHFNNLTMGAAGVHTSFNWYKVATWTLSWDHSNFACSIGVLARGGRVSLELLISAEYNAGNFTNLSFKLLDKFGGLDADKHFYFLIFDRTSKTVELYFRNKNDWEEHVITFIDSHQSGSSLWYENEDDDLYATYNEEQNEYVAWELSAFISVPPEPFYTNPADLPNPYIIAPGTSIQF